jgi:tRNA modification GTPase
MTPDLHDTIVALSSAPGLGGRAIVRLSGPDALAIAGRLFTASCPILPHERRAYSGELRLPDLVAPWPADLYVFPAPRSYTGQHMVELHTLSCVPLIEALVAALLGAGARAARAGEFTLRAFLAGKMDLTRAEAVRGVIEAGSRDELTQALAQLAGGVAQPLQELRSDLLDLLADLEAGLDFAEEDIHFVSPEDQLRRIGKGLALLTLVHKQLQERTLGGRAFRVVLAGRPNAGKSSLFNALTGAGALVSPEPGTTRDYLLRRLEVDGVPVELVDTAGLQEARDTIAEQAQALGQEQARDADLVLLCVEAGAEPIEEERRLLCQAAREVVAVATKCDLARADAGRLPTSALTGEGLDGLRAEIARRARAYARPALAPSVSRCRHHVAACLERLRQVHQMVLFAEPPELTALELRAALDELGEMVGAVYTDDLLDRIFSRFCIGK